MDVLNEVPIDCPYCGEIITILVDFTGGDQELIEDCSVCCQPIELAIGVTEEGGCTIQARTGSD